MPGFSRSVSAEISGNPICHPQTAETGFPLARARARWVGNATDEHSNCEREGSPRVASGSVFAWQHINLHGEYDFAAEKLQDSVGLEVPKIRQLEVG